MEPIIKIFHFDDDSSDRTLIPNFLTYIASDHGIKIEPTLCSEITESIEILKKANNNFDLIILDMVVQADDLPTGKKILDYLKISGNTNTVFIYTSANPQKFNFKELETEENFSVKYITKDDAFIEIKREFIIFLEKNGFIPKTFELADKDDVYLIAEINSIGETEINNILSRIKKLLNLPFDTVFKIDKLTSGLSGASIFKINYNIHKTFLLKISLNVGIIHSEYKNISLYNSLPPFLRLTYNDKIPEKELQTENVSAIIIEYSDNSRTLFDWLNDKSNDGTNINSLFETLFLHGSLNEFYKNNSIPQLEKFDYIFQKLDAKRISFVKRSIQELNPILTKINNPEYDEKIIDQFLMHKHFEEIDKSKLTKPEHSKNLILCHGDFHSRNILVSEPHRPTIIDTGGFNYDYWCSDIARLIVHLIIEGIDSNEYSFFCIEEQNKRLGLLNSAIKGEPIDFESNQSNNNFISSINWLNSHIQDIYSNYHCKWELQLGFALEFLKTSYKTLTLPHSKRMLALFGACESIKQSNLTLKSMS